MDNLIAIDFNALVGVASPGATSVGAIITKILQLVIPFAGIILLFVLMWSGFQYMNSQGDPKGVAQAQQNITYAVVGFAFIVTAYYVAKAFGVALGLTQLQLLFGF